MKTCNKLVSMVLSICLIASMLIMPAMAADGAVEMAIGSAEVNVGDTFTVVISNKDVTSTGLTFVLDFDASVVTLKTVKNFADQECTDPLTVPLYVATTNILSPYAQSSTYATVAESNANSSFAAGFLAAADVTYKAGTIATLTFEAVASGKATFALKESAESAAMQTATVTVASDEPVHTHDWAETWSKDEADHWKTCSGCTEPGEKAAHTWNEGEVTTEPTETTTGVKTYTCTVCDQTKTEEIPVLAHTHSWAETWSKDEADHWKTCSGCAEPGEKAAHTWNEGEVTTEPTETTAGVKTYTCTVCDQTKTEEIPMIPVVSDPVIVIAEEATGENELTLSYSIKNNPGFNGFELKVEYDEDAMTLKSVKKGDMCANGFFVGNAKNGEVDFGYAFDEEGNSDAVTEDGVLFTAIFDITDTKVGEYEFTLSGTFADDTFEHNKMEIEVAAYTYVVACDEHVWGEWAVTTPATCTEDGVKTRTCENCGEPETAVIPATGHTWGEWEVTTPATCTEAGVKTRTCSVCGETETAAIPAAGHNWGDDDICDDCGAEKSSADIRPVGPSVDDDDVVVLPFVDVNVNDWFYNDVVYVYENGLMNGTSATTFAPYGITTRGQIVTILWRLEGQPAVSGACPFADVAVGSYYETAITWAAANGIVTGYDATTFGPDDQITREQMAAILYRYAMGKQLASPALTDNLAVFTDADKISAYAVEAMNWAVGQGLINGMGDGTVAPQGQAIRAQAAAILHRFCETLELL